MEIIMAEDQKIIQTSVNLAVGHLPAIEIKQVLTQWYESQSGLQNMHFLQQKEMSKLELARARKINDMRINQ